MTAASRPSVALVVPSPSVWVHQYGGQDGSPEQYLQFLQLFEERSQTLIRQAHVPLVLELCVERVALTGPPVVEPALLNTQVRHETDSEAWPAPIFYTTSGDVAALGLILALDPRPDTVWGPPTLSVLMAIDAIYADPDPDTEPASIMALPIRLLEQPYWVFLRHFADADKSSTTWRLLILLLAQLCWESSMPPEAPVTDARLIEVSQRAMRGDSAVRWLGAHLGVMPRE